MSDRGRGSVSPHGFWIVIDPAFRRIEMGQDVRSITDTETSIQMFIDLHPTLGEGVALGGGRDLESGVTELNAVILGHDSLVLDSEDAVEVIPEVRDKGGSFPGGSDGPVMVMERNPGAL